MRLTPDGGWAAVMTLAVSALAWWADNNLLVWVVAPLWSMWLLQLPLGRWNLQGVEARRQVPDELYADRAQHGAWWLRRRAGSGRAIWVSEVDGGALAFVEQVGPDEVRAPVLWGWARRGRVDRASAVLRSGWPFGFVEQTRVVMAPACAVVWPALSGDAPRRQDAQAAAEGGSAHRGGLDDFVELRGWREGESWARVHWATSARVGAPMVVERAGPAPLGRVVLLEDDADRERAIRGAAAAVARAFDEGHAVGLEIDGERWPARRGAAWRRVLLDALATLPGDP